MSGRTKDKIAECQEKFKLDCIKPRAAKSLKSQGRSIKSIA
jgi:hypothetical protein